MTTLVVWPVIEGHKISAVNIASDSRISWDKDRWDYARKIYYSSRHPVVIAYSGDVIFPSIFISQLISCIDRFRESHIYEEYISDFIRSSLVRTFDSYPQKAGATIVVVLLEKLDSKKIFKVIKFQIQSDGAIEVDGEIANRENRIAHLSGSGAKKFETLKKDNTSWFDDELKLRGEVVTSRYIFQSLYDLISKGVDNKSGGSLQMVSIYSNGSVEPIGIYDNGKLCLLGLPIDTDYPGIDDIKWRNTEMEAVDPTTGLLIPGMPRKTRFKVRD